MLLEEYQRQFRSSTDQLIVQMYRLLWEELNDVLPKEVEVMMIFHIHYSHSALYRGLAKLANCLYSH